MKAITCSQCGALLKNFQAEDKFVDCEYCRAKIPITKDKVLEVTKTPEEHPKVWVSPYDQYVEKKAKYSTDYEPEPQANILGLTIVVVGIIAFLVFIGVVLINSPAPKNNESRQTDYGTRTPADPDATYKPLKFPTLTPVPNVSFKATVQYTSSIEADHIELPTIDAEQLPTFEHEELKKTVFKERRIRVRVTINPEGEVTSASALNGHQVLRESSERAAKKSVFETRSRATTLTLTYIYLLEEETD